jgi:hypothetical protein
MAQQWTVLSFCFTSRFDSKECHDKEGKPAHTKGNTYTLHFLHGILFSATITRDVALGDALLELEGATLVSSENIRRCDHIWLSVVRVQSFNLFWQNLCKLYNAFEANVQAASYADLDLGIQFSGASNYDTSLSLVLITACGTEHMLVELTH